MQSVHVVHQRGMRRWLLLCAVALIFSMSVLALKVSHAADSAQTRVVFLPFHVQLEEAPEHLRTGLTSILASRVATRARITAVTQDSDTQQMRQTLEKADFTTFSRLLAASGADYLILSTVGPDATRYAMSSYVFSRGGNAPKKMSRFFSNADDPLPAVDELAADLSAFITGKGGAKQAPGQERQGASAALTGVHPERAYRANALTQGVSGLEQGDGGFRIQESLRSRPIELDVLDLNVGDVDGDGVQELILLGKKSLQFYHYEEGRFIRTLSQDLPGHLNHLAITLVDANGNGVPELYIGASNGNLAASSIWEWRNGKLLRLEENVPYYLHAVALATGEAMLLGQNPPPGAASGGAIHLMRYEDGGLRPSETTLPLPAGYNVYDVMPADLNGDGNLEIVAINDQNRLQVFSPSGTLLWTSADAYGASRNFYGTLSALSSSVTQPTYLHTRIVTADIDFDGVVDVLVAKNRAETVSYLPGIRYFDGGSLAALKWEERGLRILWETQRMPGYIAGYRLLPVTDEAARLQLLFAEAEEAYPFQFWGTPTAVIHRFVLAVRDGES